MLQGAGGPPSSGPRTPEEGIDECLAMIGTDRQADAPFGNDPASLDRRVSEREVVSTETILAVHRLNM